MSVSFWGKREIALRTLVGVHKDNLNTLNDTRNHKVFTIPSKKDLISGHFLSSRKIEGEDVFDVYDIRLLPGMIFKSNLEILYFLYSINNKDAEYTNPLTEELLNLRDELAVINLPYLYKSTVGTYHEHINKLVEGEWDTQELVNMYGYDTYKAYLIFRSFVLLNHFNNNDFRNFGESLKMESRERNIYQAFLYGDLTIEDMENEIIGNFHHMEHYVRPSYIRCKANHTLRKRLENVVHEYVREQIWGEKAREGCGDDEEGS